MPFCIFLLFMNRYESAQNPKWPVFPLAAHIILSFRMMPATSLADASRFAHEKRPPFRRSF
ncbi:MAG: hypothetical protein IJV14_18205, partial [Lachnospiraceae bacterium]|nr:hypothetical protein [Lachnospiraceae bacterium]